MEFFTIFIQKISFFIYTFSVHQYVQSDIQSLSFRMNLVLFIFDYFFIIRHSAHF